jgi:hypothetical protein
MSDARSGSPDGGLPEEPARLPAQSAAETGQRWTGSKPLKVASAALAAFGVAAFSGGAFASGSLAAAVIVPIASITLAAVGWYRYWRTSVELTGDGTLIVRTLLRTHRVPVGQIFRMRRSEYGIRITLISGRVITAGVLQTGRWRQARMRQDAAAAAISVITRAVEVAQSARPAETAAAIEAAAPLRARRNAGRLVMAMAVGPIILIASLVVPAAGINLDVRLRWAGIAYTLLSLAGVYTLLRLARPGRGRARRHRRRP